MLRAPGGRAWALAGLVDERGEGLADRLAEGLAEGLAERLAGPAPDADSGGNEVWACAAAAHTTQPSMTSLPFIPERQRPDTAFFMSRTA
ncbi:hypothetical protein [Comamonas serinivorans]|uniref:hypothetical protein n=1 Tax=Comamonas serinivorans TaxID=1082851 RepID=UPI0012FC3B40|nr:hypothetical protein [Comamonas serinivorans]